VLAPPRQHLAPARRRAAHAGRGIPARRHRRGEAR
jgi:hypothetical protein